MTAKIAVSANTAWYLANFRMNLFKKLKAWGYEVVALAPMGPEVARIETAGVRFVPIEMNKMCTNPFKEMGLLFRYVNALLRERPAVYLGYTVKPNVYGGMACRLLGISSVNNIAGLGAVFIRETWLTKVACRLYRLGLRRAARVFFQNEEDLGFFISRKMVRPEQVKRLPGSGVDTEWFAPDKCSFSLLKKEEDKLQPFIFLLSARLLWDKGIGEYVAAARRLIEDGATVEFWLLGFFDEENPAAIPASVVEAWTGEGVIRYLGRADDVRPVVAQADCVVLPSYYREGVPRSLLEAASMGKPIITTDAVGCRETVEDGVTGYLCRPRDAEDLADKMRRMVNASREAIEEIGRKGREKMMREFDERIVIDLYLETVNALTEDVRSNPINSEHVAGAGSSRP